MSASKQSIGSNLAKVDAHSITPEEYDEIPELDDAWFDGAEIRKGETLVRRGRPPSQTPKQSVHLRLDADVLDHFRATGAGWQTRLNDTLVRAVRRSRKKAAG